jgi:thiol:disulfide interchange protein DsbD
MKQWIIALLAGWALVSHNAGAESEPLPADQAFIFSAALAGDDRIEASWDIEDGYYLYRSKFRFTSNTPGISLGEPKLPPGKIKQDEFFGEVETYRKQVTVTIPVIRSAGAPESVELEAVSQGCADMGLCYPPQTHQTALRFAGAAPVGGDSGSALQKLSDLGADFGFGDEPELLPADQAFQANVDIADADTLLANWVIADGYYLYRHTFEFSVDGAPGVTLLPVDMPEGEHKTDEFFGEIQVYHQQVATDLNLQRAGGEAVPVTLVMKYQGCAERGVCYPPVSKSFDLLLPAAATMTSGSTPPARLSEQDAIAQRLTEGRSLTTLLAFFGFGLLLAFTPCVFPMIPILSSIIVGQGETITARRGFVLSLVYVLAMALTYTAAGVLAGTFGENLQAAFQNPWILSAFAAVFVLLSLSMFGFYELQMPAFVQGRLTEISNRQKGGHLGGVAIMGFLSALIVGPCVAAPLAGALIYIGQTGDAVLGGLALFALSLGMGAPLIAIGTGAGKLLPRAGKWMDTIKAVFGVLLLAVAIWMLERILPPAITLAMWAALLILSSIYLKALDGLPVEASGWERLWKGVGIVSLVYGILLLIGAASGARDPLQPLGNIMASRGGVAEAAVADAHLPFQPIKTIADLERELAIARQQGKPVMVDFYADWCVSCKEMEKYTFAKPQVQRALQDTVLLQADVTANDDADKALLKRFRLIGPPSILFFDERGRERPEFALVGFKPADEFVEHVRALLNESAI